MPVQLSLESLIQDNYILFDCLSIASVLLRCECEIIPKALSLERVKKKSKKRIKE